MKISLSILFTSFLTLSSFSQTKRIAHRSHSGKNNTFTVFSESNFGMAPERKVKTAKLDSVIFISDTKAIMVTSKYCEDVYEKTTSLWSAGKDTVCNHPLFTKQHSLDSIRSVLKTTYFFKNPVESVKFIGYDNERKSAPVKDKQGKNVPVKDKNERKKNNSMPIGGNSGDNNQNQGGKPLFIFVIGLLSFASLLFSWRLSPSPSGK